MRKYVILLSIILFVSLSACTDNTEERIEYKCNLQYRLNVSNIDNEQIELILPFPIGWKTFTEDIEIRNGTSSINIIETDDENTLKIVSNTTFCIEVYKTIYNSTGFDKISLMNVENNTFKILLNSKETITPISINWEFSFNIDYTYPDKYSSQEGYFLSGELHPGWNNIKYDHLAGG